MKKKTYLLLLVLASSLILGGCGKDKDEKEEEISPAFADPVIQVVTDDKSEPEEVVQEVVVEEETREGMYRSELTNEWIDESLRDQRPIAVMVDNEKTALPHYGVSEADIVYEMTNSVANDGVTRLMVLVKDWESITQLGSIRSVRPTNLMIAPEWNAVVCHDGGPYYIDAYLAKDYVDHFSGTFSRVNNGKAREFTEYILPGDLDKNFDSSKVSRTYNDYYPGAHYIFASENNQVDLSSDAKSMNASSIQLPFKHNKSRLDYNPDDGLYYYSEYGAKHTDPGNDNKQLSFKNLLLQKAQYMVYDDHGYMAFYAYGDKGTNQDGYYITNGKAIPVTWTKQDELDITRYYDMNGDLITLNTGMTYIALVPDDIWSSLEID